MVDVSVILAAVLVLVTFPAAGVITGPKEKPPKGLAAVVGCVNREMPSKAMYGINRSDKIE